MNDVIKKIECNICRFKDYKSILNGKSGDDNGIGVFSRLFNSLGKDEKNRNT